jgi:hypothetical protein
MREKFNWKLACNTTEKVIKSPPHLAVPMRPPFAWLADVRAVTQVSGQSVPAATSDGRECILLGQTPPARTDSMVCESDLWSRWLQEANRIKQTKCANKMQIYSHLSYRIHTGIPAGRNLSSERIGITKQSWSSVDREIGSLRELTNAPVAEFCCPLKFTNEKMISLDQCCRRR